MKKISLPIIFITLILIILTLEYIKNSRIETYLSQNTFDIEKKYNVINENFHKLATVSFYGIINKKDVVEIFKKAHSAKTEKEKARIREELFERLKSDYNIFRMLGFKQVHFHLPNNESFLRMHKKSKYGDNLSNIRKTVVYANKNKTEVKGFEKGKLLSGMRYVYPVFDNGTHLGSVETSFATDMLVEHLEKAFNTKATFIIKKDQVAQVTINNKFADYIQSYEHKDFTYENVYNKNIKFNKIKPLGKEDLADLFPVIDQKIKKEESFGIYKELSDGVKIATFVPIFNAIDNEVISFLVTYQDDRYIQGVLNEFKGTSLFILLLGALIIFIVLRESKYKGQLEREVVEKTKKLLVVNENLEQTVKERTQEYKKQKELFETMYSGTKDAIAVLDINSNFLMVNPAYCEMTGFTKDELLSTSCLKLTAQKDIEPTKKVIEMVLEKGFVKNFEKECVVKYGKHIKTNMSMSLLHNPLRILISVRDISEQKYLQDSLVSAKQKAEESTKAKSEFLANMSHEIRTPMNGIIGMTHLVLQTDLNEKQKNFIQKIETSAKSLLSIINDILDFSKIEAGKLSIDKIDFDLYRLIEDTVSLVELKANEKNLEIIVSYDNDVGRHFYADSLRLGQILANLLSNAVKFTHFGEIGIFISKSKKDLYRFEISDTGIGLGKEQLEKLFLSFSQADGSTTRKYGGSGLGLSITKQLIDLMDGNIWVESEENVGSKFIFEIPMDQLEYDREFRYFKDKRVLIVDDNRTWHEVIGNTLTLFGIEHDSVFSVEESLEVFKACKKGYDLILMDWNMPIVDGVEGIKKINELYKDLDTSCEYKIPSTVVMVSSFKQDSIVKLAKEAGVDMFLQKPINPSILNDILSNIFVGEIKPKQKIKTSKSKMIKELKALKGMKLLLVEDNLTNQEIVSGLLESRGIIIDKAYNGQEAVNKFEEGKKYDIVLMDIQMPELDGYEATKIIRKIDTTTPIVALTANAMKEDIQKTQKVGMDEHLNKPIDVERLYQIIIKYNKNKIGDEESSPIKTIIDSVPVVDDPYGFMNIESISGLNHLAGNKKLYEKVLVDFYNGYKGIDLDSFNEEELKRVIHTIKGLSANIGANGLYKVTKKLDENYDSINHKLFYKELELILSDIEKLKPEKEEKSNLKENISNEELLLLFEKLQNAVSTRIPKKCEPIIEEITCYNMKEKWNKTFEEAVYYIKKYKFKEASEVLQRIKDANQ